MTATQKRLHDLLATRQRAWGLLGPYGVSDDASKQFREADTEIVRQLKALGHPALVAWQGERVYLWLTSDQLNFAVVDSKTRKLVHSDGRHGRAILYRYPAAGVAS